MESGPLSSPEFKEFAKGVVLFAHVTSRVPGEKYADLLQQKGGRGFPYLVAMDAEGDVLGKPKGRSVAAFQALVDGAKHFLALAAKTDPTPAEKLELLTLRIQFGKVTLEEAEAARAGLGDLSDEQNAQLDAGLASLKSKAVDKKIMGVLMAAGRQPSPEQIAEIGKQFYEMHKAGAAPSGDQEFQAFYGLVMQHAEKVLDVDTFAAGIEAMRTKYGSNPRAKPFFDKHEAKLAELRKKAAGGE